MTDAAEILNGDDYFDCRLRCRMPKAVCIARQTEGIKIQGRYRVIPESCKDCETGRLLRAEQNNTGSGSRRRRSGRRSGFQPRKEPHSGHASYPRGANRHPRHAASHRRDRRPGERDFRIAMGG